MDQVFQVSERQGIRVLGIALHKRIYKWQKKKSSEKQTERLKGSLFIGYWMYFEEKTLN